MPNSRANNTNHVLLSFVRCEGHNTIKPFVKYPYRATFTCGPWQYHVFRVLSLEYVDNICSLSVPVSSTVVWKLGNYASLSTWASAFTHIQHI